MHGGAIVGRGGKGSWRRAGVMFEGGLGVRDGVVFTTSEKSNQTTQLTEFEMLSTPSPCLWWPCLIAVDATPGMRKVRCWEQNLRHSARWSTPAARVIGFADDDDDERVRV